MASKTTNRDSKPTHYTATSPCPFCGHRGPHDDNGASGRNQTFMCADPECGEQFDAYPER